jgi:hypothetical protein
MRSAWCRLRTCGMRIFQVVVPATVEQAQPKCSAHCRHDQSRLSGRSLNTLNIRASMFAPRTPFFRAGWVGRRRCWARVGGRRGAGRPVRVPRTPFPSMRSHDWPRCSRPARFPRPVQKPTLPNRVTRLRPINGGYAGPVRCWPNSTRHRHATHAGRPRCGSRPAVRFTPGHERRTGHGAVTSGQLGKPNNDTRLPPRTVVRTNKACPEARLFPVTQACFFGLEGPANRSADMPTVGFDQDGTTAVTNRRVAGGGRAARPGRVAGHKLDGSARCRSRPGRRSVPRRRGAGRLPAQNSTLAATNSTRCWSSNSTGRGRPVPRKGIPRPIQKSTLGHLESRITHPASINGRSASDRFRMR